MYKAVVPFAKPECNHASMRTSDFVLPEGQKCRHWLRTQGVVQPAETLTSSTFTTPSVKTVTRLELLLVLLSLPAYLMYIAPFTFNSPRHVSQPCESPNNSPGVEDSSSNWPLGLLHPVGAEPTVRLTGGLDCCSAESLRNIRCNYKTLAYTWCQVPCRVV